MLFGVLIGVSLLGIGMLAATTLWGQILQRDREAELVFRGEAIARAIERFRETRPGSFPATLEELVEGRYLRRAWLDPMTNRPFRLLRTRSGIVNQTAPDPGTDETPDPGETAPAGITGVASTSDGLAFRPYRGQRRYQDWRFEAEVRRQAADPPPRPNQ